MFDTQIGMSISFRKITLNVWFVVYVSTEFQYYIMYVSYPFEYALLYAHLFYTNNVLLV